MASKDYDDLLESFMNNSQKVYNDDKNAREAKLPSSYKTTSNEVKKVKKKTSDSKNEKPVKEKSAVAVFFGRLFRFVLAIIMIVGVVGVVCSSVLIIYAYSFINGDKVFDLDKEKYSQNQTSFIYGYDNKDKLVEITRLHGEENRIWLNLNEMSPYLAKAFIAIEDERYEEHHGVDWKRVGGVILRPSQVGQGGSTITQQLIKNLTDSNDVTFVRKFNEMLSALNLEKHYNKDQIMEAYLNTIYLSHGCYGVKTAAETYFGKEVKDLNIAECACLAAITKAPTRYDPILNNEQINPANGISRRKWIIEKMLETGQITQEEHDKALQYKMVYTTSKNFKKSKKKKTTAKKTVKINSYYTDFVIDEVISDLQKMGYSAKKSKDMIYGGGLKIYTAIDFDVQKAIEDVYENYKRMPDESVQGACVVMDYRGRILGMVGGTGKKKANRTLNRAWQSKRQPGSTIKPLSVYGPALQKSLDEKDLEIYWSTPTKDAPLMQLENGKWWPTNEGGSYSNSIISIQKGLAQSKNTISARTLEKIGPSYSYDFMVNRWHISTLDVRDEDFAPMATGSLTHGVTVLEMTTAYQAFGNGGYYYEGYGYYKIEDSQGNVIVEKNPDDTKESALAENTAGVMNKLLQTVMTQGTGTSYKLSGIQCFGKTGTTTESKDRWFIGGTPEYVCGVWYGYDQPKEIHYYLSPNPCGTIWNYVMHNIYDAKGVNESEFEIPDGVVSREYSPVNGKLCRGSGMYGYFDENNLPGYTTYVATTEETTENETKKKDKEEKTTKKDKKEENSETTKKPEETSKPETTAAPEENDNGEKEDEGE
ncbi:MAG: penicillin-binding protein [Eubacterium sp.]|nr:penicillin-binding protein [Eubacterium sp.]